MDYLNLKISDIRKEYKNRYPDKPSAGKGITKQYLIDEIKQYDSVQIISETPENIQSYYKANDDESFKELNDSIINAPNPNVFNKGWGIQIPNWNSDEAWIEYHRELQLIGSDDNDTSILEKLQEPNTSHMKVIPNEYITFSKKYPMVTWVVGYLHGGVAFHILLSNATKIADIELLKRHIVNNSKLFSSGDVHTYVTDILDELFRKRVENAQKLLDDPIKEGPREEIEFRQVLLQIPVPGDIMTVPYRNLFPLLIISVHIDPIMSNTYYVYAPLEMKQHDMMRKSSLKLPKEFIFRRHYPLNIKEKKRFIQYKLLYIPEPRATNIEIKKLIALKPYETSVERETFIYKNKIHTIPLPGDILHAGIEHGAGSIPACPPGDILHAGIEHGAGMMRLSYYLVYSIESNPEFKIHNIWYNVLVLKEKSHHKLDMNNLEVIDNKLIRYFPKKNHTKDKIENILYVTETPKLYKMDKTPEEILELLTTPRHSGERKLLHLKSGRTRFIPYPGDIIYYKQYKSYPGNYILVISVENDPDAIFTRDIWYRIVYLRPLLNISIPLKREDFEIESYRITDYYPKRHYTKTYDEQILPF